MDYLNQAIEALEKEGFTFVSKNEDYYFRFKKYKYVVYKQHPNSGKFHYTFIKSKRAFIIWAMNEKYIEHTNPFGFHALAKGLVFKHVRKNIL